MPAQDNPWSGLDGPAKTVTSIVALLTAWAGYIKTNLERRRNARVAAAYVGDRAWLFRLITEFSPTVYLFVGAVVFFVAALQLIRQGVEKTSSSLYYLEWFSPISTALEFSDRYFWIIIGIAILVYLVFLTNILDVLVCRAIGLVPGARNTIAWANASWFIEDQSKTVPVVSVQQSQIKRLANDLVNTLVATPRSNYLGSNYLALRPGTLSLEVAGNVLLFGHVIEEYFYSVRRKSFQ